MYIPALGNQTDRVRGSRASRLHILIIKLAKATVCLRAQHLSTHTKSDFTTMQGFGGLRSKHNRHVMEIHIITRIARHITLSTDAFCTAQVAASHEPKPTIPQRGERLLAPAVASHPGLPAAASHEPKQSRLWLRQRSPQRGERILAPVAASHAGLPAAASHETKQWRLCLRQRSPQRGERALASAAASHAGRTDPALWRPPPARRLPPMCKLRAERSV